MQTPMGPDAIRQFDALIEATANLYLGDRPVIGRIKEAALLRARREAITPVIAALEVHQMAEAGMTLRAIEAACRGI